mmetsp:Transcript_2934/g.8957  ORF Transcript_2934/g.8957 Transcript_2934/m.8957 type:complete len:308 (+) Transcript_2934:1399-2322(+)
MVAGIKGVAFFGDDGDTVAATSSTKGELFLVSRSKRQVVRRVHLGGAKAESLCAVPGTRTVLVADARGRLCSVDCSKEPATVACVATADHHAAGAPRLTSVAAWDKTKCYVAGAARGEKTKCAVRAVDLIKNQVDEAPLFEAPMIRALLAEPDRGRLLVGAVDGAGGDDDAAADAATRIVAVFPGSDAPPETLATIEGFVHSIAKHPGAADTYALLCRHSGSMWTPPVKIVRLHADHHVEVSCRATVKDTLHITKAGLTTKYSIANFSAAVCGARAGREHAMALAPDGGLVTGCVDVRAESMALLQP